MAARRLPQHFYHLHRRALWLIHSSSILPLAFHEQLQYYPRERRVPRNAFTTARLRLELRPGV